jgi:hypothetical protein
MPPFSPYGIPINTEGVNSATIRERIRIRQEEEARRAAEEATASEAARTRGIAPTPRPDWLPTPSMRPQAPVDAAAPPAPRAAWQDAPWLPGAIRAERAQRPGPFAGSYGAATPGVPTNDQVEAADDTLNVARENADTQRRTIRRVVGPDGKVTFTNVGNAGDVYSVRGEVAANAPDVGAPGRGSYASGGEDNSEGSEGHLQYLRNSGQLANYIAEQRRMREDALLTQDPFLREREMAGIQADAYANRQRSQLAAEQEQRQAVLGQKADIDAEYNSTLQSFASRGYTPEQMVQAQEMLDRSATRRTRERGSLLTRSSA